MTTLPELVDQRLGEVGARLNATTGGQALCRLDGHMASAKELEGRMAVLMEVRRAVRQGKEPDLGALHDRWSADRAARVERGASAAWISYLDGGVAEVGILLDRPPAAST